MPHRIKKPSAGQRLLNLSVLIAVFFIFLPQMSAGAETGKKVEKDTDDDGVIDRIVFFDERGRVKRLEIDNNKDGEMDHFQFYEDEDRKSTRLNSSHSGESRM